MALLPFPAQRVTGGVLLHPWLSLQAPPTNVRAIRSTGSQEGWRSDSISQREWALCQPALPPTSPSCPVRPLGGLTTHLLHSPPLPQAFVPSPKSLLIWGAPHLKVPLFGMLFHPIFPWLVSPLARVSPPYPWPSLKSQSKNSTRPCSSIFLCSVFILSRTSTYFLTNLLSGFPSWIRTPWG